VTVLVTGAGGFIGSHLCERLIRDGEQVRALVRYTSRRDIGDLAHLESPPEVTFGDLRDPYTVRELARGVDTVYHLGASISVPYSYEAPRDFASTNVEGTLNVLSAARAEEVGRVVHLSSSEVYGTARYTPIDEAHPLQAQSPYSATKIGADKLAESFHCSFELPVVTARPFNTFGPRQSPRAVIPTIVAQALAGDTVRVGSLFPRRDFVFVEDTVDALVRLGRSPEGAGEVFNIATGADISIGEVIDLVAELLGKELEVVPEDGRVRPEHSEVHQLLGDATKLRDAFGWSPGHSFRDGLARTIDWLREHPRGVRADEYAV
jgi:NAD dependent epimerase/dehydratase